MINYKQTIILVIIIILLIFYNIKRNYNEMIKKYLKMLPSNSTIINHYKALNISHYISPNYKKKYYPDNHNIIYITDFLNKKFFNILKNKCNNLKPYKSELLSYNSQGNISFYNLIDKHLNENLIEPLNLYYSNEFLTFINNLLNIKVNYSSPLDYTTCSIVTYDKIGDFIDWHNDYNAYYGNRWTVLITLINTNNKNDLSSLKYCYKHNNNISCLKTEENSILIFNGSILKHMTTKMNANEKRTVLAMTLCDSCVYRFDLINYMKEYIKKSILYGFN